MLFLTPRFPWPLIGGDRIKSYNLLKHLALSNRVILVTFNHGVTAAQSQLNAIREIGVEVHSITLNPFWAGLSCLRTLWTNLPLEIAFYTRPDFRARVDEILSTQKVDIGISFFMRTAEYLRDKNDLKKILISEDCRVEYQSRSRDVAHNFKQKVVRWWETSKLLKYEPEVVNSFDRVTFVSPEDVEAMTSLNSTRSYDTVTNGVDLDRYSYIDNHESRSGILFTGKLDVLANHIMAKTIIEDILPKIQTLQPSATLTIAGACPLSELRSMLTPGVKLLADVPDLLPHIHSHAIFIHPHRGGSGIQNKILEAMSAGCVVITTPSGLQGIEAQHGVHCLVASNSFEMANLAAEALSNPTLRSELSYNARLLMEQTHSWALVDNQIDTVVQSLDQHESTVSR
ncbi:MAG: glycosyltransferase [Ignavibacteria bacterium]|nr:glycosyltransferase [Ignavibacteria bacterium]